ncbi:MAG: hypothetical protein JWO54_351 [Candidatus Saccharibacteria bacterium]|nr:hypothetical protein [Candidatus Saccharibacteria bacterium]MDB5180593.1 hypothetical protein [Candidatus Saccharibacteria bacterium]
MDAPKVVQVDRASATIHTHMETVWGALREDGSVAWKATGSGHYGPVNWENLEVPEGHGAVVHVTISYAVERSNLQANMTLLFEDGSMANSWPDLRDFEGWSFDQTEPNLPFFEDI